METESLIITMTEEIWKDIPGYEGLYQVSNFGRVKSLRKAIIMSIRINKKGYSTIGLSKNGVFAHRNTNFGWVVSKTRGFAYGIAGPCVKQVISHTGTSFFHEESGILSFH